MKTDPVKSGDGLDRALSRYNSTRLWYLQRRIARGTASPVERLEAKRLSRSMTAHSRNFNRVEENRKRYGSVAEADIKIWTEMKDSREVNHDGTDQTS